MTIKCANCEFWGEKHQTTPHLKMCDVAHIWSDLYRIADGTNEFYKATTYRELKEACVSDGAGIPETYQYLYTEGDFFCANYETKRED